MSSLARKIRGGDMVVWFDDEAEQCAVVNKKPGKRRWSWEAFVGETSIKKGHASGFASAIYLASVVLEKHKPG